jgi:uncharacterized membrane protein
LTEIPLQPGDDSSPPLPSHVEGAVEAIAAMHAAHHREASLTDKGVDRTIAIVGRPAFLLGAGVFIAAWIGANWLFWQFGKAPFDGFPFPLLDLLLSCAAIVIAVLILASQRRADRLANLREQTMLELALLTAEKTSKIIELLEELRRDSPGVQNRVDLEALEMAAKRDHETMLNVIQDIDKKAGTS